MMIRFRGEKNGSSTNSVSSTNTGIHANQHDEEEVDGDVKRG